MEYIHNEKMCCNPTNPPLHSSVIDRGSLRFRAPKHIDAYFDETRDSWVLPVLGGHETLIDERDRLWVREYAWYMSGKYVHRSVPLLQQTKLGSHLALHREILGRPGLMHVDHINGDTLDNRFDNLRVCTPSQNSANRKKSEDTKNSKYKGVSARGSKWSATICARGLVRYLGVFDTEIEATKAYDRAAIRLFEQFSKTNSDLELL